MTESDEIDGMVSPRDWLKSRGIQFKFVYSDKHQILQFGELKIVYPTEEKSRVEYAYLKYDPVTGKYLFNYTRHEYRTRVSKFKLDEALVDFGKRLYRDEQVKSLNETVWP